MFSQVHAVMQNSQDINDILSLKVADSEYYEVSAFFSASGNVKRPDIGTNFAALFGTDDHRAGA